MVLRRILEIGKLVSGYFWVTVGAIVLRLPTVPGMSTGLQLCLV